MTLAFALAAALAAPASAKTLWLEAYDGEGRPLPGQALLSYIAPRSRKPPAGAGIYVTDLGDKPAGGRPWLVASATGSALVWSGPSRVRVSLPWPVADDGFSTVFLDNEGAGYADGDRVLLNEAIALTQFRLFKESLEARLAAWEPNYKPSARSRELQEAAQKALADAKKETRPAAKAALYEKALTRLSAAWAKMLFDHGTQTAAHPKLGPTLRWGLTLDETLASRVSDFDSIAKKLGTSGANWVRLVFRQNPDDFAYASTRSFLEYDAAIAALKRQKLHIMASVLDSTLWPRGLDPKQASARARNLVMRYQETIRSWEVASEPNGDWLGGRRGGLSQDAIVSSIQSMAAEVKRIDRSLETVATLYWWEGTAGDDVHPTFAWLRRASAEGALREIDVVGLSIYADDNPMGLAFDTAFRRLHQSLPDKRLMVGGFGYVEGKALEGYWWLEPGDVDAARKDLLILYTGAAPSVPSTLGGGFWWSTLSTMLDGSRESESVLRIYKRTAQRLGR